MDTENGRPPNVAARGPIGRAWRPGYRSSPPQTCSSRSRATWPPNDTRRSRRVWRRILVVDVFGLQPVVVQPCDDLRLEQQQLDCHHVVPLFAHDASSTSWMKFAHSSSRMFTSGP